LFTSISRLAFRRVIADLQAAGCLDAAALTNWSAPALSTAFKSPQDPKTNSAISRCGHGGMRLSRPVFYRIEDPEFLSDRAN